MPGAKKCIRYFCWCLFGVTLLAHGYFQASSESSDDQMSPAVTGATLSKTLRNIWWHTWTELCTSDRWAPAWAGPCLQGEVFLSCVKVFPLPLMWFIYIITENAGITNHGAIKRWKDLALQARNNLQLCLPNSVCTYLSWYSTWDMGQTLN